MENLCEQFHCHMILCLPSMDKVSYTLKQKKLQHHSDHLFFLCLIRLYLEKPEWYTVFVGQTFEDFCIG